MNEDNRLQLIPTLTYNPVDDNHCIDGQAHCVVWQQPTITGCDPKDLEEVCIKCGRTIQLIRYDIRNGVYKAAPEDWKEVKKDVDKGLGL